MQDFFGTEINVNDYLFYAIRDGNMASAKVGKVVKLHEDNKHLTIVSSRHGAKGILRHVENSIVIPEEKALTISPFLKDM